ncbi:YopX family protein [Lactococcus raffinolactis]|uniref:YopX family protein n=1 Tax=Pseudolactococcus raffinolactis TaxID=1366 RepID=UPI0039B11C59
MVPKFRCFDKFTKTMHEVVAIDFKDRSVYYESYGLRNYWSKNVVLMQSTGLYDNNGVEIFEGDIVEHLDFNSNEISKSEVRILKGCFYLVISVDGFKYDVPMMDLKDDECILEIKGNVHENPELLEDV